MRALVLVVCGCGSSAPSPDAACVPGVVYLNRTGGAFAPGPVDDAVLHHSILLDAPTTMPPWPHDEIMWSDTAQCIRDALAPFPAVTVTETAPAGPHVEIVFTTAYWAGPPATTFVVPDSCRSGHQLEFVFGDAIATAERACHLAMLGFAEMTAQLSLVDDCHEILDLDQDCVPTRSFIDADLPCTGGSCRCGGGTTQNAVAAIRATFPACP